MKDRHCSGHLAAAAILGAVLVSACGPNQTSVDAGAAPEPVQPVLNGHQPDGDASAPESQRPNILLIVADDLGWSDIGAYGGEIRTPNIDKLASAGVMFTNFHVNTTCSPTRAMLYSGVDAHVAGYGTMAGLETPEQLGQPGYEVYLNDRVVAFPRLLQKAGYRTYLSGKWDQGGRNGRGYGPHQRGFERSFVLVEGLADHFRAEGVYNVLSPVNYLQDGEPVDLPEDFYSTRTYTEKLIDFIDEGRSDGQPFFAMLSFTAPHYPLQALDEDLGDYEQIYAAGYKDIRAARLERQRAAGLIDADMAVPEIFDLWPEWSELSPEMQKLEARRMAAYAAMITSLDRNVGRLISYLEDTGVRKDTVIIFMSDNGPDQSNPLDTAEYVDSLDWMKERYSFDFDEMGRQGGFAWTGPAWASVSATPWAFHKHFMTRGGVNVPFIASFPGWSRSGEKSDAFSTVLDLYPTFLELAGAEHPGPLFEGRPVVVPVGQSLVQLLQGHADRVHEEDYVFGQEIFDRRMIQKGNWKIVWSNAPWGKDGEWSLYNLADDPAETRDLAGSQPEKLAEMIQAWEAYVETNGVILNPGYVLPIGASASHYEWAPDKVSAE